MALHGIDQSSTTETYPQPLLEHTINNITYIQCLLHKISPIFLYAPMQDLSIFCKHFMEFFNEAALSWDFKEVYASESSSVSVWTFYCVNMNKL